MLLFHLLFMMGALLLALLTYPSGFNNYYEPHAGLCTYSCSLRRMSVVMEAVPLEFAPSSGSTSQSGSHGSCCPGAGAAR